jgi:acyl carrier protein
MQVSIEDITRVVGLHLGRRNVAASDRLVEDLDAESADLVNIIATLEEKYNIQIAEEEIPAIRSVTDLCDLVNAHLR